MEKGWVYVYLAVFIALFLILNSLGFFGEKGKLTGFAVIGGYENQTDCVEAGYTWEDLTEQNCTNIPDCIECAADCLSEGDICAKGCVTVYTEVLCADGCILEENLCEAGCQATCQNCSDVIVGGQCIGDICDADHLILCLDETTCVNATGYWYGVVCNIEAECVENWECTSWGDCTDETQIRTCSDLNACGPETGKPSESQSCTEDDSDTDTTTEEESSTQVTIEESNAAAEGSSTDITPTPTPSPTPAQTPTPITGGIVEDEAENETCVGCLLNNRCYETDKRKKGKYCIDDGSWVNQTLFNQTCVEGFECKSNSCKEETCTKPNIITAIINWFKELFEIGISLNQTTNETINSST